MHVRVSVWVSVSALACVCVSVRAYPTYLSVPELVLGVEEHQLQLILHAHRGATQRIVQTDAMPIHAIPRRGMIVKQGQAKPRHATPRHAEQ